MFNRDSRDGVAIEIMDIDDSRLMKIGLDPANLKASIPIRRAGGN
jgi:hypothetical protein